MKTSSFLSQSALGFHRVSYTEWGIINPYKHGGTPVICVHGLTRNGRDFDNFADALHTERQVFCPDIIGRGKSDWLGDPSFYGYPQYVSDMAAMIARTYSNDVDWIGTSMGGIIGMFIAAMPNSPIRRLVLNDIGPIIPLVAMQRICSYLSETPEFADIGETEKYMRQIYTSFGPINDKDWKHMATYGTHALQNGKLALAYDPAIARNMEIISSDVDIWAVYDKITCPTLVLRGATSDILSAEVAEQMTKRGPNAKLVTFNDCGHAPSLMNADQIKIVADFINAD